MESIIWWSHIGFPSFGIDGWGPELADLTQYLVRNRTGGRGRSVYFIVRFSFFCGEIFLAFFEVIKTMRAVDLWTGDLEMCGFIYIYIYSAMRGWLLHAQPSKHVFKSRISSCFVPWLCCIPSLIGWVVYYLIPNLWSVRDRLPFGISLWELVQPRVACNGGWVLRIVASFLS